MGVIPLIARPERNLDLVKDLELTRVLVGIGASMQVTAGSVTGDFGRVSKKYGLCMLDQDLVSFLVRDPHPGRKYRMAKVKKKFEKIIGISGACDFFKKMAGKWFVIYQIAFIAH
ncbi:MAG: hypothetical protein QM498_17120 [Desulfobacterium sp.]